MPAKIVNDSASKTLFMTFPLYVEAPHSPSMNFGRLGKRLFQLFKGKRWTAGNLKNWRLAAAAEFGRIRQLRGNIERDHNSAVTIGVNPGVRRADRTCEGLESGRPLRDVADRSVGDDAKTAQRLMH